MRRMPEDREEGHYWVRWSGGVIWDVLYWRDGHFWDFQDCGYRPEHFRIGHRVYPPDQVN